MTVVVIDAESVTPQAWRNGGGQTRELLAWPAGADWRVRISRADIDVDGPFSAFPGVERWFTVLQGAGVVLTFADGDKTLSHGDVPLFFDGAAAPGCRLIDGPTRDLNLMVRHGKGAMRQVQSGQGWSEPFAMRGIYTDIAGQLATGQHATHKVDANTMLWMQQGGDSVWSFEPDTVGSPSAAWWLGFTPED